MCDNEEFIKTDYKDYKNDKDKDYKNDNYRQINDDTLLNNLDSGSSKTELQKFKCVCNDFMNGMCGRESCKYIHDIHLCKRYWRTYSCKYGNTCRKNHYVSPKLYDLYLQSKSFINKTEKEDCKNFDFELLKKMVNIKTELTETQLKQVESLFDKKTKEESNYKAYTNDIIKKRIKNTETFEPMKKPVDMRIIYDLGCYHDKLYKKLTTRDVLLVPNLFRDFEEYEIYNRLVDELKNCGIPEDKVIIPWHGNNVIKGTHMIASDWEKWKRNAPTFNMVVSRIREFFNMNVKATRLNWYQDTEQWKAFHFDSAKINPEKAKIQNFTVAASFGRTRDCAFERDDTMKNVISIPIGDGEIYCFTKETNENWRHGVLQELPKVEEGRISIVAWGWIDDVIDMHSVIDKTEE